MRPYGECNMQGIIQKGRDLRSAGIDELRETLTELLYELRYRFSTLSKENFGRQDLIELAETMLGILTERELAERKPLTVTYDGEASDASLTQILQAKKDGRRIVFINENGAEGLTLRITDGEAVFCVLDDGDGGATLRVIQYFIQETGTLVIPIDIVNP